MSVARYAAGRWLPKVTLMTVRVSPTQHHWKRGCGHFDRTDKAHRRCCDSTVFTTVWYLVWTSTHRTVNSSSSSGNHGHFRSRLKESYLQLQKAFHRLFARCLRGGPIDIIRAPRISCILPSAHILVSHPEQQQQLFFGTCSAGEGHWHVYANWVRRRRNRARTVSGRRGATSSRGVRLYACCFDAVAGSSKRRGNNLSLGTDMLDGARADSRQEGASKVTGQHLAPRVRPRRLALWLPTG